MLEERLGIALPEPAQLTVDDINAAATAAEVLRTGEGTHTVHRAEAVLEQVSDVSALWKATIAASVTRREVTYAIFGREVSLGEADYETPLMNAVDVTPLDEPPYTFGPGGVRAG